jgi:demethylmenaquinone methyltransferase/2-methoxy-6-polyprenyl-1,4-benzoquinol methylase
MWRVSKPGGRLVICEFSRPVWKPLRKLYLEYLMKALPVIAKKISSNPESYVYLAESIRQWPSQKNLGQTIASVGWDRVTWKNLTFGVVALHIASKP